MAVVVVGGHSRNIGKTSVVAGLIARLPEFHWTAFKITQYGHGFCTADGAPCDCQTDDHTTTSPSVRSATPRPAPTVRAFSPRELFGRCGCGRARACWPRRCRASAKRSPRRRT